MNAPKNNDIIERFLVILKGEGYKDINAFAEALKDFKPKTTKNYLTYLGGSRLIPEKFEKAMIVLLNKNRQLLVLLKQEKKQKKIIVDF